jgi:predicted type IV restriction endonuclease
MNKLPISVSERDFETYILPNLSHKIGHNRQKVSYHYIFNTIIYVLKSGCSWRTLKPDNQEVTWQNIYYHYAKWSKDGSFSKVFEASISSISDYLALECLQIDGTHTPSKKGAKKLSGNDEKGAKQPIK